MPTRTSAFQGDCSARWTCSIPFVPRIARTYNRRPMRLTTTLRRSRAVRSAAGASLLLAALTCNFIGQRATAADLPAPAPAVPAASSEFHVDGKKTLEFLASDDLEGRGVNTAG